MFMLNTNSKKVETCETTLELKDDRMKKIP